MSSVVWFLVGVAVGALMAKAVQWAKDAEQQLWRGGYSDHGYDLGGPAVWRVTGVIGDWRFHEVLDADGWRPVVSSGPGFSHMHVERRPEGDDDEMEVS